MLPAISGLLLANALIFPLYENELCKSGSGGIGRSRNGEIESGGTTHDKPPYRSNALVESSAIGVKIRETAGNSNPLLELRSDQELGYAS